MSRQRHVVYATSGIGPIVAKHRLSGEPWQNAAWRLLLRDVLVVNEGSIKDAAEHLDITYRAARYWVKELGMQQLAADLRDSVPVESLTDTDVLA